MTNLLRRHLASILKSRRFVSNFFLRQRWLRAFSPLVIALTLMIVYFWPLTPATPAHADLADEFVFVGIDTKFTRSVAWGDMDGDGDLDLAIGNYGAQESNRVYRNEGDGIFTLVWESDVSNNRTRFTTSVAWGDMDGDGDLDLAVGNEEPHNEVYRNDGITLESTPVWTSTGSMSTRSVAWGDMDGDGDLDLAVGNYGQVNEVYTNTGLILADGSAWTSTNVYSTTSVAWGDVNGDGHLDLAVGNFNEVNQVYTYTGSTLGSTPYWSATTPMSTTSVAWGDVDGDGKLDLAVGNGRLHLAVGNDRQVNQVYTNTGSTLGSTPSWTATNESNTASVVWGDWDGDSDLDLAVGNWGEANQVYTNTGTMLGDSPAWQSSGDEQRTSSVAWGDMDGDGDLDLAVGNHGQSNQVHLNDAPILRNTPVWTPTDLKPSTHSVAWGDMDGDGNLDLAVGNWGKANQVYTNTGTILGNRPAWTSTDTIPTRSTSVAWGDMDGDGDLDLAVGNANQANQVYRNENGRLRKSPVWTSTESYTTTSIAWGDMNGDGFLDLAVGNEGQVNQVYINRGGILAPTPVWTSTDAISTTSVAWGDMDGDGNLDLAVGNYEQANQVYLNQGDTLEREPTWESSGEQTTRSVAWGDVDGDRDIDLAVGNDQQVNQVYLNEGGTLAPEHAWQSSDAKNSASVAWGDMDGDRDLDLGIGNYGQVNQVYRNVGGTLELTWESVKDSPITGTLSVAWGDMDGDGDLELAVGNETPVNQVFDNPRQGNRNLSNMAPYLTVAPPNEAGNANFYASSKILDERTIPITYTLFHTQANSLEQLAVFYSLDGGGHWIPAIPTNTTTTNLDTSPDGVSHLFTWDTFESGFFGQSDNVVLRFVAHSQSNNGIGPYLWPASSATTFPFRVRGTQVQVLSDTSPVADAFVYRLPLGQHKGALPMADSNRRQPFRTNPLGYLQGRGILNKGDRLVAFLPISATESYTLYHTSATPTLTGLDAHTVAPPGVQQLVASEDNPLILFNLDVSLEWDARNNEAYLSQLENDLKRTSQILYDWTNGQAALGDVRVYHNKENWLESDVLVHASNNLRPHADIGGLVREPMSEQILSNTRLIEVDHAYLPGQARMAVVWNRFGHPSGELGVDWPRTLAHELGHYLLFLPDNYLGSDGERLIRVDCQGSAMTDPYREDYSEFLTLTVRTEEGYTWTNECQDTLAERTTGRTDWETITTFYPMLNYPREDKQPINPGPSDLPLEVTNVTFMAPETEANTLADPLFYITDQYSQSLLLPFGQAQGYLFKTQNTSVLTDDLVVAVGSPVVNLLLARGAEVGDRLCVFDYSHTSRRIGCVKPISQGSAALPLYEIPKWKPEITVTPENSRTLAITVTQEGLSSDERDRLRVQVLPADPPTFTVAITSPVAVMAPIGQENTFVQTITLEYPISNGFVRVWVTDTDTNTISVQEEISEFFISDGWGPGGKRPIGVAPLAPIISNDGQVSVLDPSNIFRDLPPYVLQSLQFPPELPVWLTPVGEAYRFLAARPLTGTENILFRYLQRKLPDENHEDDLQIYYYNPDESIPSWQPLETELNTHQNVASALMPEPKNGTYALMSTIKMPAFEPGWNNFGYPLVHTQTVTTALASIDGAYTSIYNYDPSQPQSWTLYDRTVADNGPEWPTFVNDLTHFEFGRAYWIHATQAITLYLGVADGGSTNARASSGLQLPPATFYGWVTPMESFEPAVGMTVTAQIDGTVCGQTTIKELNGQLAYKLQVMAENLSGEPNGCGTTERNITFKVEGEVMHETRAWNNNQAWFHQLGNGVTAVTLTSVTAPATAVAPNALLAGGLLLLTVAGGLLYRRRRE